MNKIVACLSGLTLAVAVTAAQAEAPSANKPPQTAASVMACMRANIPKTLTVKDVQLDASDRSEEHTSELQSLMRISYAVFCLKKKKSTQLNHHTRVHAHKHHITQQTTEKSQ